ncbi:uncharacterized protein YqgV (UPF0045/DUF77 family) [Flavimobilis soli]|uniref:Uncharacterized protein YqgV (UPF0045/DUF77 family) n=1 Tax=Flavimobilis soli TaxID=442709 RepID=A0A2A9EBA3_9MICO|nr:thiamine-binding protein [Flavimobilis soli]PFG35841.1 uncharacterized protein YqgV (UPF0045/DUF77 family) [Flavimobilis soli]
MLAHIQVSPRPAGTADQPYAHIDPAIAVIQDSGLVHEVGAMGTTVQGSPDEVWALLRRVHEATLAAGARGVTSHIKVGQGADDDGPTIEDLVAKFRA